MNELLIGLKVTTEQRSSVRKIMRGKAVLVMDGFAPTPARTLDIGMNGMCVGFDHKLEVGQTGKISFEMFLDGKGQLVSCRSKVSYCIFSGDQFKIGFQFIGLEPIAQLAINKYLR
jgi:hypothetical protein